MSDRTQNRELDNVTERLLRSGDELSSQLESNLSELSTQLGVLTATAESDRHDVAFASASADSLRVHAEAVHAERDAVAARLAEVAADAREAAVDLQAAEHERAAAQADAAQADRELSESRAELQVATGSRERARTRVSQASRGRDRAVAARDAALARLDDVRAELSRRQSELAELAQLEESLRLEDDSLSDDVVAARRQAESEQSRADDLTRKVDELNGSTEAARQRVEDAKSELERLSARQAEVAAGGDDIEVTLEALQAEHESLLATEEQLLEELSATREQVLAASAGNDEDAEERARITVDIEAATSRISDLRRTIDSAHGELTSSRQERDAAHEAAAKERAAALELEELARIATVGAAHARQVADDAAQQAAAAAEDAAEAATARTEAASRFADAEANRDEASAGKPAAHAEAFNADAADLLAPGPSDVEPDEPVVQDEPGSAADEVAVPAATDHGDGLPAEDFEAAFGANESDLSPGYTREAVRSSLLADPAVLAQHQWANEPVDSREPDVVVRHEVEAAPATSRTPADDALEFGFGDVSTDEAIEVDAPPSVWEAPLSEHLDATIDVSLPEDDSDEDVPSIVEPAAFGGWRRPAGLPANPAAFR